MNPSRPANLEVLQRLCERAVIVPIAGKRRWLRACISLALGRSATAGLFHELLGNLESEPRRLFAACAVNPASQDLTGLVRYHGGKLGALQMARSVVRGTDTVVRTRRTIADNPHE